MALAYQISLYILSFLTPHLIPLIPDQDIEFSAHIVYVSIVLLALIDASDNLYFTRKTWKLINNPFNEKKELSDLYICGIASIAVNITLVILNN